MVLFLIPVAAVGYKVWDHHQKKKAGQQGEEETTNRSGEPSRVVDTLPCDDNDGASEKDQHNLQKETSNVSAADTAEVTSLTTTDNVGSCGSPDDADFDDQTLGALGGFRKFWEGKMDDLRARELQKNKNRELAMKIANGSMGMPKISYK